MGKVAMVAGLYVAQINYDETTGKIFSLYQFHRLGIKQQAQNTQKQVKALSSIAPVEGCIW